jgi:hypothetical protein
VSKHINTPALTYKKVVAGHRFSREFAKQESKDEMVLVPIYRKE